MELDGNRPRCLASGLLLMMAAGCATLASTDVGSSDASSSGDAGSSDAGGGDAGPRSDGGPSDVRPDPAYGLFNLYHDEYAHFRELMRYSLPDFWRFTDRHAAALKVRMTRTNVVLIWALVEPTLGGGYRWDNESETDAAVRATYAPAPGKQMDLFLVLDPSRMQGIPSERQRSYPHGHEAEYQAFVRAAVERYDGDGVGDLDANVRVKYWQVMNEPFSNLQLGLLTVEEYVSLVKLTAQAVREADPEAHIVLGDVQQDIARIVPQLADGGWFDAVDSHFYPEGEDYVSPAASGLRLLLDAYGYRRAEVWFGELGVYLHAPGGVTLSDGGLLGLPGGGTVPPVLLPDGGTLPPLPSRTAADQARILVKTLVAHRALGVSRIYVVNLVSWSYFGGDPQSLFNFMGLISSGILSGDRDAELGKERIAYYAFQRLVATTETDVAELVGLRGSPGDPLRLVEFRRRTDGKTFYLAWADGAGGTLNLGGAARATVTNLVPSVAGSFTQHDLLPSGGSLLVTVGKDPLLIEPQ